MWEHEHSGEQRVCVRVCVSMPLPLRFGNGVLGCVWSSACAHAHTHVHTHAQDSTSSRSSGPPLCCARRQTLDGVVVAAVYVVAVYVVAVYVVAAAVREVLAGVRANAFRMALS